VEAVCSFAYRKTTNSINHKNLTTMKRLMILAILAMQVALVCAQQNDFYYAGVRSDTLAAVYKNNELLYTNFEEESWYCGVLDLTITNEGDVYYAGNGNYGAYIWKNGERIFSGGYRSVIKSICYNEDVLYSVGDIFFEELVQQKGAIWKDVALWDTLGTSRAFFNDIDFMDGHSYILGTNHMVNGIGDLTIWKDDEPLYVLGRSWEGSGLRTIICHEGHVYACGGLRTNIGPFSYDGMIWKDGEVLYNYGSYACIRDFCIDGEDIYACGEINVENQEQKAMVWKNGEVLYEYDYEHFIGLYTILKVGEDLYFGGAGYYFGKQPNEMLNSSYGVLFKNGEAIEIDPECTTIYALAVAPQTNALQETGILPMRIFPNPTQSMAHVDGIEVERFQVFNTHGQLLKTELNTNEIHLEDLPKGFYLLRITDAEGKCHKALRVVKE
jgi:hypothetical protein